MTHRVLELFAGLGGLACAAGGHIESVAIDIDQHAKRVFVCNYGDNYITREIESLSSADLRALDCDSWWLSPPCQLIRAVVISTISTTREHAVCCTL